MTHDAPRGAQRLRVLAQRAHKAAASPLRPCAPLGKGEIAESNYQIILADRLRYWLWAVDPRGLLSSPPMVVRPGSTQLSGFEVRFLVSGPAA